MKNVVFWDDTPCGSCTNRVSKECSAFIFRMTRIGELGTTLAVTTNLPLSSAAMESLYVPPKRRFLQDPHGVNIPEDGILDRHRRKNLKSCIIIRIQARCRYKLHVFTSCPGYWRREPGVGPAVAKQGSAL
jgi:hypothetical protein